MTIAEAYFSELIRIILSMTFTGSILSLFLFLLRPIIQDRLPKFFQYYMWFPVIIALLLPISEIIVVPVSIPISDTPVMPIKSFYNVILWISDTVEAYEEPASPPVILFALWLSGTILVLGFHVLCYMSYIKRLDRYNRSADWQETELLDGLSGTGKPLQLYKNIMVMTPILIGFFRPAVILPDKKYKDAQLRNILMHEVAHRKRHDIFVKWLLILVGAVHWFNPLIYLVRREINRVCELSCDEFVIKGLNISQMQQYGDTLITVAADSIGKTPFPITMFEDKKNLKERLGAIMEHKQYSKRTAIVASFILAAVFCAVLGFGALYGRENRHIHIDNVSPQMQIYFKENEMEEMIHNYDKKNIVDVHVSLDLDDEITNAYIFILCNEKNLGSGMINEIKSLVSEELDIQNIYLDYRSYEIFSSGNKGDVMGGEWK